MIRRKAGTACLETPHDVLYYVLHTFLVPGFSNIVTSAPIRSHMSPQTSAASSLTPIGMAELRFRCRTGLASSVISDSQVLTALVLSLFENGGDVQVATGIESLTRQT